MAWDIFFFLRGRELEGFQYALVSSFNWRWRGPTWQITPWCCQKILEWLINIMFLPNAEIVIKSDIKSRFSIISFSQVIPFCGFLSHNLKHILHCIFLGWWKILEIREKWINNMMNALNITELYTLTWLFVY